MEARVLRAAAAGNAGGGASDLRVTLKRQVIGPRRQNCSCWRHQSRRGPLEASIRLRRARSRSLLTGKEGGRFGTGCAAAGRRAEFLICVCLAAIKSPEDWKLPTAACARSSSPGTQRREIQTSALCDCVQPRRTTAAHSGLSSG